MTDMPEGAARRQRADTSSQHLQAARQSFLADVVTAEQHSPLPAAPPPAPNPADPAYVGRPDAYDRDKQAFEAAAEAFGVAAKARGAAVAQVIARWLARAPYAMLQELLDQPRETMPNFRPAIGPVVVMRHDLVLKCLERTDLFTVDLYAPEMARATDDRSKRSGAFAHFLLGTDREDLYCLDDVILRRVMSRRDETALTKMIRRESEYWTERARTAGQREIDVVPTLAQRVPLRIVASYIGVPFYGEGEPSALSNLSGGDPFPLDPELQEVFTFSRIQNGVVPTVDDLFGWIKDAFRNSFNNFSEAHPMFGDFRERGIVATEYLTAYVFALLKTYKARLQQGATVPDTMLTRLLRLQLEVERGRGQALGHECSALLDEPVTADALAARLSDSMIRSNVFGTAVGAVVNPQEATARIIDSMLRLKDGEYDVLNGSTYDEAVRLAAVDDDDPTYGESQHLLRMYALEALRLRPQGEVLLRLCVKDNTELGSFVRKGTPVFVAYAGAMRDPSAVVQPLAFDIHRDQQLVAYRVDKERAREAPQSRLYLQHGFGRHKCLGRYASEITMREALRAMLRLGALERRSELELDEHALYVTSLKVGF